MLQFWVSKHRYLFPRFGVTNRTSQTPISGFLIRGIRTHTNLGNRRKPPPHRSLYGESHFWPPKTPQKPPQKHPKTAGYQRKHASHLTYPQNPVFGGPGGSKRGFSGFPGVSGGVFGHFSGFPPNFSIKRNDSRLKCSPLNAVHPLFGVFGVFDPVFGSKFPSVQGTNFSLFSTPKTPVFGGGLGGSGEQFFEKPCFGPSRDPVRWEFSRFPGGDTLDRGVETQKKLVSARKLSKKLSVIAS